MRNKVKSLVLVFGLLALVIGISACGYVSSKGDGINVIPHSADWGFTNCLVCHSDGEISVPDDHVVYTNELCLLNPAGCHALSSYTPVPPVSFTIVTTTSTPTQTTPTGTQTSPTGTQTTTITPPVSTTAVPQGPLTSESHGTLGDSTLLCMLCHMAEGPNPNPEDHLDYTNESCFDTDCHLPAE